MTTLKIPKFRSAKRAADFAVKHKVTLNEETEKLIAQDAVASYNYAYHVKGKFELAEPLLAKDLHLAVIYAIYILKGRFYLAEKMIAESITEYGLKKENFYNAPAFNYARSVCQGRFELLEPLIINDPDLCYHYAADVIGGRWEEGEPTIAKDLQLSLNYARYVLDGRFELAEPLLAQDSDYAFEYASDVINRYITNCDYRDRTNKLAKRFELGEEAISKNIKKLAKYIDLTKQELTGTIHNMMIARSLTDDLLSKTYFDYISDNKKTLLEYLSKYPENMTVKEITQSLS